MQDVQINRTADIQPEMTEENALPVPADTAGQAVKEGGGAQKGRRKPGKWKKDFKKNWQVYLIFLPIFVFVFVFNYLPMFGIVMAFQEYDITKGFFGSEWVGWANFEHLFSEQLFGRSILNTVIFAAFNLVLAFPCPILFAMLATSVKSPKYRRVCQTIAYLPNFVASVVMVNIVKDLLDENGAITMFLAWFGLEPRNWLAESTPPAFWLIYTFMGIWQGFGFGSIMFVAAISNVSDELKEAAVIDGANRWQIMWKVIFPNILPLIVMMLTLQIGVVFKAGYDKILLMDSPSMYQVTETLYTYTYHMSFGTTPQYGLGAASGLFQSVICTVLLFFSNWLSKKVTNSSLF